MGGYVIVRPHARVFVFVRKWVCLIYVCTHLDARERARARTCVCVSVCVSVCMCLCVRALALVPRSDAVCRRQTCVGIRRQVAERTRSITDNSHLL